MATGSVLAGLNLRIAVAAVSPVLGPVVVSAVACPPVMLEDTWRGRPDGATVLPSGEPRTAC